MASKMKNRLRQGKLVSTMLAGAWRPESLPDLDLDEAGLNEVTPLLYGSGAAALGWKRVARSHLKDSASAELLHQAYRLHALQAAIHEQKIAKVFGLLNRAGVDAFLAKGWAAASLYSDTAMRPYGDIDLCVRPDHFSKAEEILSTPEAADCWVDLHKSFVELKDRRFDELFERARLEPLNGESIRIPSEEDHLALLCIHLLKHGAWRPIWLCDIAAAIESLPDGFDWKVCLGTNRTRANWIETAIALSQALLQADTGRLPKREVNHLPAWLIENVLLQWSHPFAMDQAPMNHLVPISGLLRQPANLIDGLRNRWPNAIIATISVNGRFNNVPRLPYQLANCGARMASVLTRTKQTES